MNVLLTLMVRNESRILKRCIDSASKYADTVLVVDTGSTDTTVEIAKEAGAHVIEHTWKNFGHNRSLSFRGAVETAKKLGWNLTKSYALVVDADMVLDGVRPELSGAPGYHILQKHGTFEYANTRYLRLDIPWKCTGVTHEYWDGAQTDLLKEIWINDIGDGGCKSDKFERDIRLLTQGLRDEPKNGRYMFYLAQSYRDSGNPTEAIKWYKKRIAAGGWDEEVWYAMYSISKIYHSLGDLPKMELWVQRAYAKRPSRNEALVFAARIFREKGEQFKAWHYLKLAEQNTKTDDMLFIETDVYGPQVLYEKSICHYYVSPTRSEGLRLSVDYLNSKHGHHFDNVFSNMTFYCEPLKTSNWKRLQFPVPDTYTTSSIAVNSECRMNVRAVNYRINDQGGYSYPDGIIRTKNYDSKWNPITREWYGFTERPDPDLPRRDDYIRGLEDVRLFGSQWTATTREYSNDERNRILCGDDTTARLIQPPTDTGCEKNWIPIGGNRVIYDWHPFQIGAIGESKLEITVKHSTPPIFQRVRGSSPPFRVRDRWVCLVHLVKYGNPRTYLHMFVGLNDEFLPMSMSLPFVFRGEPIEYCIGAQCWNDVVHIFTSSWDRESWQCTISADQCVGSLVPFS